MVTAIIKKNSNKYVSFECKGHAGFAEAGSDIVCSAISMLSINTANSIIELTDTSINPKEKNGFLFWEFTDYIDDKATLLMDSLVLGLKTIEDTYSNKYLTLNIEEV